VQAQNHHRGSAIVESGDEILDDGDTVAAFSQATPQATSAASAIRHRRKWRFSMMGIRRRHFRKTQHKTLAKRGGVFFLGGGCGQGKRKAEYGIQGVCGQGKRHAPYAIQSDLGCLWAGNMAHGIQHTVT